MTRLESQPASPADEKTPAAHALSPSDTFIHRHIGPTDADVAAMLDTLGYDSLDALTDAVVPPSIRAEKPMGLGEPRGEFELLQELKEIAEGNTVARSCIGQGYYDTITPPVIQRNILENPGWYTQYTPYQAEIAQGRLEALLNFQTMVADLTGLPMANASLLDEPTAAAEAMAMCFSASREKKHAFFVDERCHPQTINVVRTRAESMGIELFVGSFDNATIDDNLCGALVQYPDTFGAIAEPAKLQQFADALHDAGALLVAATDLLALTLIKPPGEWGADIAVGSAQRFGVPMGGGGPHAAFMACREKHVRKMPGRIVGVSKDTHGNPAYRLAIQTREQHIKRERATSNICTAQVLLAIMASMYAVYHGPKGLRRIAQRVRLMTAVVAKRIEVLGNEVLSDRFFDTIRVRPRHEDVNYIIGDAQNAGINLRDFGDGTVGISLDETTCVRDIHKLDSVFTEHGSVIAEIRPPARFAEGAWSFNEDHSDEMPSPLGDAVRTSPFLTHPVFNSYHSETEMLRYIRKLESRDLSLTRSMIPLGSCTMKLNGTSEMLPVTWPAFARVHPYAPAEHLKGYAKLCADLEDWLCRITGFAAVSLQPNAGSQGEYAGLLAIRGYHASRGEAHRNVCLIPVSAHGTNPASAVIAGFDVVAVACDQHGNIDAADLRDKAKQHEDKLGALMITYPSTHGVFEPGVRDVVDIVHEHGGQVYLDGANMNAQVGLTSPAIIGADVCHLNLHKTFCIPHGGGGPGMGPIGVAEHLAPFLPGEPLEERGKGSEGQRGKGSEERSDDTNPPPLREGLGEGEKPRRSIRESESTREASTASPSPGRDAPIGASRLPSPSEGEGSDAGNQKSKIKNQKSSIGPVAAARWGSASILPISWVYIALMGEAGLKRATQIAILNANYMAKRLAEHYPVVYAAENGTVAHEFIIDCREFKKIAGVEIDDIAKRLMDYGFHAPTMSFPVPGTLMIEPTESESKAELDRLCDALIAIRAEISAIERGESDRADNALKYAPHTAPAVTADDWPHKYSRKHAAYPAPWVADHKFWPHVARIDNPYGDRNLFCTCVPMSDV